MTRVTYVRGITGTNAASTIEPVSSPQLTHAQDMRSRAMAELIQKFDVNLNGVLEASEQAKAEAETGINPSAIPLDAPETPTQLGKRVHVVEVAEIEVQRPEPATGRDGRSVSEGTAPPPVSPGDPSARSSGGETRDGTR
jgi:hypothetical protein